MLSSSKIALLCVSVALAVPACTLALGDFDPASTSAGSGGSASIGVTTGVNTTSGMGGMGGVVSTSTGHSSVSSGGTGGDPATGSMAASGSGAGSSSAGVGGSSGSSAASSAASSTGSGSTCNPVCPMTTDPCQLTMCIAGTCVTQQLADGTSCPGGSCFGGMCSPSSTSSSMGSGGVVCFSDGACAGMNSACTTGKCVNQQCKPAYAANGSPGGQQTDGDCKKSVCNGSGGIQVVNDDTDVPMNFNPCTAGTCNNGVGTFKPANIGLPCGAMSGFTCNGAGMCVPPGGSSGSGNPMDGGVNPVDGGIGLDGGLP